MMSNINPTKKNHPEMNQGDRAGRVVPVSYKTPAMKTLAMV